MGSWRVHLLNSMPFAPDEPPPDVVVEFPPLPSPPEILGSFDSLVCFPEEPPDGSELSLGSAELVFVDRRARLIVGVSPPGDRGAGAAIATGTRSNAPMIAGRSCMIRTKNRERGARKRKLRVYYIVYK